MCTPSGREKPQQDQRLTRLSHPRPAPGVAVLAESPFQNLPHRLRASDLGVAAATAHKHGEPKPQCHKQP